MQSFIKSVLPLVFKEVARGHSVTCGINYPSGKICQVPGNFYAVMRGYKPGTSKIIEPDMDVHKYRIPVCEAHAGMLLQEFQHSRTY